MTEEVRERYEQWQKNICGDDELTAELIAISNDDEAVNDRFYRELKFGTGGLRGVIGAGTNRMNVYTVARATQGYCNYLNGCCENPSVAIAYDSRIKSDVFAKTAARVFAANGIHVNIFTELMPTPALSFAIRYLKCDGGIVITASHNPSKYNGYKVYGADGCQITTKAAKDIYLEIEKVDQFLGVKTISWEKAVREGHIADIEEEVVTAYLTAVSSQSLCKDDSIDRELSIVYTPLNGSGLKCVTSCLKKNGFNNISVVEEQREPDGQFPTCPYPNPEVREALELGLRDAKRLDSDLLLATDPDCDRVGIAVKAEDGYTLLSGNEVGMLLLVYICERRIESGNMPEKPILMKSIVSIDMADRIARDYGVETVNVLTGFKFIGEQIGLLEKKGETGRFILGFEESYGYLTGRYVRDKDGVNASLMICEMCAYYKARGMSLLDVLKQLYQKYGYCLNTQHCYEFEGAAGSEMMQKIMDKLRGSMPSVLADKKVVKINDYKESLEYDCLSGVNNTIDLPKSNVLKFILEDYSSIIIRPSGTEPKIKVYFSVIASDKEAAERMEIHFVQEVERNIIQK